MSFLAILFASTLSAHAGTVEDQIQVAKKALADQDSKAAQSALKTAEKAAPDADVVLSQTTVAQLHYYRGMGYFLKGDKKERDMDAWRKALVANNELQWDTTLSNSQDGQSLFEALRREVRGRPTVDTGVSKLTGKAEIYVDGVRVRNGDTVLTGTHLGQIVCDDESVHGLWTSFSRQVDWFDLCPGGVDTSVVVTEEEPEDDWAEFGPAFGAPAGQEMLDGGIGTNDPTVESTPEKETEPTPEPEEKEPEEEAVATTEPAAPSEEQDAAKAATPPETDPTNKEVARAKDTSSRAFSMDPKLVLLAGGSTLFAGSLATNFLIVNPAYEDIEAINDNGETVTRAEAEQLEARFAQSKLITFALGGGGVALVGASFLLESPVTPWVGPSQIGVRGRF
jgi:hypothetical protein